MVKYAFSPGQISPLYEISGKSSQRLEPTEALPFGLDFVNLTMCFIEVTEELNNGRVFVEYTEKSWFKSQTNKTIEIAFFTLDPTRKVAERMRVFLSLRFSLRMEAYLRKILY